MMLVEKGTAGLEISRLFLHGMMTGFTETAQTICE
jgi:hypothetical protein